MRHFLDRLAIRVADALGLDRCVMICRVQLLLCWSAEMRPIYRELLTRVQANAPQSRQMAPVPGISFDQAEDRTKHIAMLP